MSADQRLSYVDSSAIVKLAVAEPESSALRSFLGRRASLVSSALATTEVARALGSSGPEAVSARQLGSSVRQIVTYDERMADAARASGWSVASPR